MCSIPDVTPTVVQSPNLATPVYANANATKMSNNGRRNTLFGSLTTVKTSSSGLLDSVNLEKKKLLGE